MSDISKVDVTCPACKVVGDADVYHSVNVTLDPLLKARLLTYDLFTYRCSACHGVSPLVYGFIYHDRDKRLMIDFSDPDDAGLVEETMKQKTYRHQVRKDDYRIRRVSQDSFNTIIEIIRAIDFGIDDMAVQIVKILWLGEYILEGPWFFTAAKTTEDGYVDLFYSTGDKEQKRIGVSVEQSFLDECALFTKTYAEEIGAVQVDETTVYEILGRMAPDAT